MSQHDQKEFIRDIHPFDKLDARSFDLVMSHMDIAYYPTDTTLISPMRLGKYYYIIIKGEVDEYNDDELSFVYHKQDGFDADSLIYSRTNSTFVVSEDLICYILPREIFLQLMQLDKEFAQYYLRGLASRLEMLKSKNYDSEFSPFMFSRVNQLYMHKPFIVNEDCSIEQAATESLREDTPVIIVRKNGKFFSVSDRTLKQRVVLAKLEISTPIGQIAKTPFISVGIEDFVFSVLLKIIKYSIETVGVMEKGEIIGVLTQSDILSYFANHSYILAVKINKASTIQELRSASQEIDKTIKSLFDKGLKTTYIAKMIGELNAKVYQKLFGLILPKELQKQSALLVMGSEGRDEQIVKTDQDNALIIADGVDVEQFYPYMQTFTKELISFGFPRCDGDIMVSNPYWCKSQSEYEEQIKQWFRGEQMQDYMDLAIFFDAKCVAGDCSLHEPLKELVFSGAKSSEVFMAYFANATLNFKTPIGLFSSLQSQSEGIDIKKGGIFAIVQGIRALALENGIAAHTTIGRIKELHQGSFLEKDIASELIEALGLLSRMRLQGHLRQMQRAEPITNIIDVNSLSKIERDMLKDSFVIVNSFKKLISHHFHLDRLS